MRLGLDAMGGDFAPKASVEGAFLASRDLNPDDRIVLYGDEAVIQHIMDEHGWNSPSIEIIHCPESIGMGEQPTKAYTQKRESSIFIGLHDLKAGKIDAFSSAGNTGAMLVGSVYTINPVPGFIRPCTLALIPKINGGYTFLLAVGTNPDVKTDVLYQFAMIGSIYAESVHGVNNPRVGLLNIGEEDEKGNLFTLSAFNVLKDSNDFNFIGNVEGRDFFNDKADVIVCDGFTGNVVLKQMEAFYRVLVKRGLRDEYIDRFNYEIYGGTPVLGINATVMIGHGISSAAAFRNMLLSSRQVNEAGIPARIKIAIDGYTENKS
jgi:phosphate acyltransferase